MPIAVAPPVGAGSTIVSIWAEEGRAASTYEGTVFPVGEHDHPTGEVVGLTTDLATRVTLTGAETLTNKTLDGPVIRPVGSGLVGAVVKGLSAQTGNLLEVRDNADTVLLSASASGGLTGRTASLTAPASGDIPLVVKGATGQTANLLEARNSADAVLTSVKPTGALIVGGAAYIVDGVNARRMFIDTNAPSNVNLVVRGAASQTANLAEFQNSSGTVLASVNAAGALSGPNGASVAGPSTQVRPVAGGGQTLPTTPEGYLRIFVNGVIRSIAYYPDII